LAEVWDHFFTETLPTLQAIFYPVQVSLPGKGLLTTSAVCFLDLGKLGPPATMGEPLEMGLESVRDHGGLSLVLCLAPNFK
jgi:hypothetical protein